MTSAASVRRRRAELTKKAGLTGNTWVKSVGHAEAEALYKAIQDARITAPPTDCVQPIGTKTLLAGLLKEVKAEFYSASTRPADGLSRPAVHY